MLCETAIQMEAASTWVPVTDARAGRADWRVVDRALRSIAARRAGLDAEELRWLREAEMLQIWRPLGMVSALDYLERVFGYPPRIAQERLRMARALGALPILEGALATGKLPFSAVRELTRVVTPATEAPWVAAACGKNLRQVEDLVSGHRPGDRPEDAPDPEARTHVVRFELSAPTFAQLRQAHQALDDDRGRRLSDDDLVAALCDAVLAGAVGSGPSGRARFQIAVTVCERCQRGWQDGAGAKIAIDAAAVERALCDAQHIGSLDGDGPERAHQDVPPSMVRFVWRRDGGRCRVPGCRSARGLEIHHLVHRADGGTNEASNLALLCSSCHLAHHSGALTIRGPADQLLVQQPCDRVPPAMSGTHVGTEGDHGTHVGTAGDHGTRVGAAGDHGTHVGAAGDHGTHAGAAGDHGTHAGAAGDHGTHAGAAGDHGTHVGTAGDHDTHAGAAGDHGTHAGAAGDHSTHVGTAGDHGTHAGTAGDHGTHARTAGDHGTHVGTAGDHGTHVGTAGDHGTHVGR